ncbi:MAG: DUF1285 domain-containing protein [Syntrophobacterales bacterium]|nr:MAG: DUF1285 domain-containing protein [Syntrophobacterales bacterium]
MSTKDEVPSLPIRVDKEGIWYYQGALMFRKDILEVFFQNLKKDEEGRYMVELEGDRSLIEVEDTPIVVEAVAKHDRSDDEGESIEIFLSDSTSENLDLSTLRMNTENVLYCSIRNGAFEARVLRAAYYQIAEFIEHDEEKDSYFIPLNGKNYYIDNYISGGTQC